MSSSESRTAGMRFPHRFSDVRLLDEALTHRSRSITHNDRLEWLGDCVLNLALSRQLYSAFPEMDSGRLSLIRSSLVRNSVLAEIACELGIPERLNTDPAGLAATPSVQANAFEALLGAVSIDSGYEHAGKVVVEVFGSRLAPDTLLEIAKDPKTMLNEMLNRMKFAPAAYTVLDEGDSDDSDRPWRIACVVDGKELASASGPSKALASRAAAVAALAILSDE